MARVKRGVIKLKKRRKLMKLSKGYRGARSRRVKAAQEAVMHALQYAFEHRRERKREMRRLWIARINAACRLFGLSYNHFISGLKQHGININRKMLAEIAIQDDKAFKSLVDLVKEHKKEPSKVH
jgi:large subunit ribosomal protein L20